MSSGPVVIYGCWLTTDSCLQVSQPIWVVQFLTLGWTQQASGVSMMQCAIWSVVCCLLPAVSQLALYSVYGGVWMLSKFKCWELPHAASLSPLSLSASAALSCLPVMKVYSDSLPLQESTLKSITTQGLSLLFKVTLVHEKVDLQYFFVG